MEIVGNSGDKANAGGQAGQNNDGRQNKRPAPAQIFLGCRNQNTGAVGKISRQITVRFRAGITQKIINECKQTGGDQSCPQAGPDQFFFVFDAVGLDSGQCGRAKQERSQEIHCIIPFLESFQERRVQIFALRRVRHKRRGQQDFHKQNGKAHQ